MENYSYLCNTMDPLWADHDHHMTYESAVFVEIFEDNGGNEEQLSV